MTMRDRDNGDRNNLDNAAHRIPCNRCDKACYCEAGRGLDTRISEQRVDESVTPESGVSEWKWTSTELEGCRNNPWRIE